MLPSIKGAGTLSDRRRAEDLEMDNLPPLPLFRDGARLDSPLCRRFESPTASPASSGGSGSRGRPTSKPTPNPAAFESKMDPIERKITPQRPQCPPTPLRTPTWAQDGLSMLRKNSLAQNKVLLTMPSYQVRTYHIHQQESLCSASHACVGWGAGGGGYLRVLLRVGRRVGQMFSHPAGLRRMGSRLVPGDPILPLARDPRPRRCSSCFSSSVLLSPRLVVLCLPTHNMCCSYAPLRVPAFS